MKKDFVILLTATLNPGVYADAVKRSDPDLRAQDYAKAIEFWTGLNDPRIAGVVVCENSGADPATVAGSNNVEWLSFNGNTRPSGMNYGYSELGIIDHALYHSRLLAGAAHFLKVTGRLTFPRLPQLISTFPDDLRCAVDCRRAYQKESGPRLRARTELMMFSRDFYLDRFYGTRDQMQCSHIEEFFGTKMLELMHLPGVVPRFKIECPPVGVAAHNGKTYHAGRHYLKSKFRQLLRVAAPGIWR